MEKYLEYCKGLKSRKKNDLYLRIDFFEAPLQYGRLKLFFSESALKTGLEKGLQFILKVSTHLPWISKLADFKWSIIHFVSLSSFFNEGLYL